MHIMVYAPYGRAGVYYDAGLLPVARDRRRGRRAARSRRDSSSVARRPPDQRHRETGEGFHAARRARRRVAQPPGSRLFRATTLRLARAVRHQVRALARAGGLSSPVWGDRWRAAWSPPCRAFLRAQHAAVGASARNDGQAQLRGLSRRPRTPGSTHYIRGRRMAQLRSLFDCHGR